MNYMKRIRTESMSKQDSILLDDGNTSSSVSSSESVTNEGQSRKLNLYLFYVLFFSLFCN